LPLWRILGGCRESMTISITIGIKPVDQTMAKALEWIRKGFTSLKIKRGADPEDDV
jgi:L-alanine-DL-glutamate epimerase-like enolase superfamily enzyme